MVEPSLRGEPVGSVQRLPPSGIHMNQSDAPSYGASDHYVGGAGHDYFRWQHAVGEGGAAAEILKLAPYLPDELGTVLDLGCGGGFLLAALPSANRRIGVELNPAARQQAVLRLDEVIPALDEVADGSVDVVITNHALEHIPDPVTALVGCRRVLGPGGRLVVCVPIDDWRTQRRVDIHDRNFHLYTWTPQLLHNALVESGFAPKSISVDVIASAWPPGHERLLRTSRRLHTVACRVWAVLRRRRQLVAVAVR